MDERFTKDISVLRNATENVMIGIAENRARFETITQFMREGQDQLTKAVDDNRQVAESVAGEMRAVKKAIIIITAAVGSFATLAALAVTLLELSDRLVG